MECIKRNIVRSLSLWGVLLIGAPVASAASAPPLTHVQVLKVQSAPCGIENIAEGQEQTKCDHGGASIKVYVLEVGYGRVPTVGIDGFTVEGTQAKVCANDNGNLTECTGTSRTIVGTLYIFDLGGRQGGTFTFSNTSINAPGNTLSTQLYIK
ncbi:MULTISPECIES: DUF4879 domain-containing protein [unclassified Pseudomonas]|uniref:DUF4879 domain-containing protein n=1 Tax=unclassified Pseudomonas TaxID=196821 RepID=UPI002AC99D79|nr:MULTISPECIES: DUF4879 domain-containing protein [unclassified Pseudomonas]MEB0044565.1 DUF4879 domain-containing protein [Pseudomonas sp. Dout3]MEB0095763.1 DUF4879 domain-containing protein [Pseudomonas sp. DC1.2]WPX58190.1 DUF4879 domain-containing protein [Pseudomonas sp. DC1.2]